MDVLRCDGVRIAKRRLSNRLIISIRKFCILSFFPEKYRQERSLAENAPWCDGLRSTVRHASKHVAPPEIQFGKEIRKEKCNDKFPFRRFSPSRLRANIFYFVGGRLRQFGNKL